MNIQSETKLTASLKKGMQSKDMPSNLVQEKISPRANFKAKKFQLKISQEQTPQGRAYSSSSPTLDPPVQFYTHFF